MKDPHNELPFAESTGSKNIEEHVVEVVERKERLLAFILDDGVDGVIDTIDGHIDQLICSSVFSGDEEQDYSSDSNNITVIPRLNLPVIKAEFLRIIHHYIISTWPLHFPHPQWALVYGTSAYGV